ncbi:hypothetical protein AV530_000588 [Patagioenas fasciata monilis]|uniref:Uncharacterized protein n=1 Tax=Patagioenas fasciata monilis TaxID=372326 RepID=A0A1V4IFY3_PATFA|nr:hypothetical protein AV530_000588 [Patagioenas fasciata monilis]
MSINQPHRWGSTTVFQNDSWMVSCKLTLPKPSLNVQRKRQVPLWGISEAEPITAAPKCSGRLLICYTAEQRTRLVRSDQPTQATVTELLTVIHNFFTHQLGKGHILGLLSSPTRCVHVKFLLCCASTDGLRRYT